MTGHLRWRWLSRRTLIGLFAIVPSGWVLVHLREPEQSLAENYVNPLGLIMAAMLVVGLGIVVLHLVNHTSVTSDGQWLEVRHGPIPWFGGGRWAIADIARVFVETHVYGSGGSKKARSVDWTVNAVLRSGEAVELVGGPITRARADEVLRAVRTWIGQ